MEMTEVRFAPVGGLLGVITWLHQSEKLPAASR